MRNLISILLILIATEAYSQISDTSNEKNSLANNTFHFQSSLVSQWHGKMNFPYAGPASLDSNAENKLSLTSTIYYGKSLWKNASIFFNPEITGGSGFSQTRGIAGFPNGEIYRVGNPTPIPVIARMFLRQIIPLSNASYEQNKDGLNQIAGEIPDSRIAINIGKFSLPDYFDNNDFNHDARTQFLNWALMGQGAWDYTADTRGYTSGIEVEIVKPSWELRYAFTQMQKSANNVDMDWNMLKTHGHSVEYGRRYTVRKQIGIIRISAFRNTSGAPYYSDAVNEMKNGDYSLVSIISGQVATPFSGHNKYGFGLNIQQDITKDIGTFFRFSWNDGKTATWSYSDIDDNIQLGININGRLWSRLDDHFGIAQAVNGISNEHREYLMNGGYSFLIGDGKLNYGNEIISELFYNAKVNKYLSVSADYQLIFNPGYNKDRRGPLSIPGIRIHIEI